MIGMHDGVVVGTFSADSENLYNHLKRLIEKQSVYGLANFIVTNCKREKGDMWYGIVEIVEKNEYYEFMKGEN